MKRELFLSFTGHLALLVVIGIFTARQQPREITRPGVITVQILPGSQPPENLAEPKTRLLQPSPPMPAKKTTAEKTGSQPKKNNDHVLRRAGLGARVEGIAALGYNYYLQQLLERISENWQDPFTGRATAAKAVVMFVIERDGQITEVKLERSSGEALFDEACLRSVLVTGKLPPLPDEFTAPRLKIHLEFER